MRIKRFTCTKKFKCIQKNNTIITEKIQAKENDLLIIINFSTYTDSYTEN